MPAVARIGDPSSHGGTIVAGSGNVNADGTGIARVGDMHVCPIPGHGSTPLQGGSGTVLVNGQPCIRVGDSAGCGATIVSGAGNVNAS